jgi:hypothetical protein
MLRVLSGLFWTIIVLRCPVFFAGAVLTATLDRRKDFPDAVALRDAARDRIAAAVAVP